MQVDSNNFQQHVDLILQDIQTAHFVSFDCEFTGLVTQLEHIEGLFPDHRQFYERIKETALNFNLLQLGLTLFRYQNGEYHPKSYNFYVSASENKGFNKVILAQWESMAFLARNGMDFSHAFKYGIKFKRINGQLPKNQLCNPLQQRNFGAERIFFNPYDKKIINDIEDMIKKQDFLKVDFKSKRIFDFFRNKYDMSFDKPKKNMERFEYTIKIYNKQDIEFKDETPKRQQSNSLCEKVEDVCLEQKNSKQPLTLEVVIAKIIECGKPIVGHFPNLDIGLIYHSFIKELPNTFQEFTEEINTLFPYIFDTKVISRRLQDKMKSIKVDLKSLYRACFNKKQLQSYANINYKNVQNYLKQQSSHEAGYDSFMTGCAFIAMLNYLYEVKQIPFVFAAATSENKVLYSKFAGQISLVGPIFSERSEQYKRRIVIYSGDIQLSKIGEHLSSVGTNCLYEDRGEAYYFFDEDQDINSIIAQNSYLKPYDQRKIVQSRHIFS